MSENGVESGASGTSVSVVVLEPNPFYRSGLVSTIEAHEELHVVADAPDGVEAVELLNRHRPDVAVLDAAEGIDMLEQLSAGEGPPRTVVLAAAPGVESAYRALAAGASAYLSKDEADAAGLCDTILAVSRGQMILSSGIQANIARDIRDSRSGARPDLTSRELEVLALIAQGLTATGVAERLEVSPATVKTHLHHLYKKLGVSGRAAAVAEAMRRGLVE